jgi:hypothetical protein
MHRGLFFDLDYGSWNVREDNAVLGIVAGCSLPKRFGVASKSGKA